MLRVTIFLNVPSPLFWLWTRANVLHITLISRVLCNKSNDVCVVCLLLCLEENACACAWSVVRGAKSFLLINWRSSPVHFSEAWNIPSSNIVILPNKMTGNFQNRKCREGIFSHFLPLNWNVTKFENCPNYHRFGCTWKK